MEFKNIPQILNEPMFFSLVEKTHENLLMETDYGYFQELATQKNGFRITRKAWESGTKPIIANIKYAIIKELEVAIDKEYIKITNKENSVESVNAFIDILNTIKARFKNHNYLSFCEPLVDLADQLSSQLTLSKMSVDEIKELPQNVLDERIVCNLEVSVLGKLIRDLRMLAIPESDKKCIENNPTALSRIIQRVFVQSNGEEYSVDSLATYIKDKPKNIKKLRTIQVRFED